MAGRNRGRNKWQRSKAASGNGHLTAETREVALIAEQAVERAKADTLSKQPRFRPEARPDVFYGNINAWLTQADLLEPSYSPDSRRRDGWLRTFWRLEPHLAGVMNSVVALDKNRGWSLTGGRNQVYRLTAILHAAQSAPGLDGWRNFLSSQSLSYYSTDMGTICETGRDGEGGPLRALYHTDSARCRLTGLPDTPLEYTPSSSVGQRGGSQLWPAGSYFRVASMPSDDESYSGLGYCAASRVLELAKLMVAVFRKDAEMLGARMPEGLLLLQGIGQQQWDDAMADREAKLTAKEREYFGGVFVLATAGIDQVDAKLIALRQLPENFNLQTFTDMLMFSYALAFGYSPREFWPVSSGALGTATEAETQDNNSTGKGESDFILNYQERLQDDLPETAWFEFEQRDSKGDLELLAIQTARADFVDKMSRLQSGGMALLPPERIMEIAAEQGLIPADWLAIEGDIMADDTQAEELDRWRHKARTNPRVLRAVARYPDEPIVRYAWPSGRMVTLFDSAGDMQRRRAWPTAAARVRESVRLAGSIERAARALEAAPDTSAELMTRFATMRPADSQPQITIVTSADGAAEVLRQQRAEPSVINVNVDTAGLGHAIAGAINGLPGAIVNVTNQVPQAAPPSIEITNEMPPAPNVSVTNQIPQAAAPNIEITNQVPQAAPPTIHVDVPQAAPPSVNVTNQVPVAAAPTVNFTAPEPVVNITNEIQAPVRETADFKIAYDSSGRPISVHKEGESV